MLLLLIYLFLLIKLNLGGEWINYPSPLDNAHWKCGVTKRTYVCDPDGLINEEERKEIVKLVENFKEKTKRPNSKFKCVKEGIRLVLVLSKDYIGYEYDNYYSNGKTGLCTNDKKLTPESGCVQGIEMNQNGFYYCKGNYSDIPGLYENDYELIRNLESDKINNKEYFNAIKSYIENIQMLYNNRLSVYDEEELQIFEHIINKLNLLSILIICIIIIYLFYKLKQIKQFFKQRNTCIELIQQREEEKNKKIIKNKEKEEEENEKTTTTQLLNL